MEKYSVYTKFIAKEGKEKELLDVLTKAAQSMEDAKGCMMWIVFQERKDKKVMGVMEVWETREDQRASLLLEGMTNLIGEGLKVMDGRPEQTGLTAISGKGLPESRQSS